MPRFRIFVLLLAIATSLFVAYFGYVCWLARSSLPPEDGRYGLMYSAEPLSKPPPAYWNLTNPEPYVLEAIRNPNTWVEADEYESNFSTQISAHGPRVEYEGVYYRFHAVDVEPKFAPGILLGPVIVIVGVGVGLCVAWISVGIMVIGRRRRRETRS